MKITKFGHCCLLIDINGTRILTDPGSYTVEAQDALQNIDLILITHEHQDHFHIDSIKKLLVNNPNAEVITNSAVGNLLDADGIKYQVVADAQSTTFKNIAIEGHGHQHAVIYEDYGQVENTGYFIDGKLFYPGDALTDPGKPVDILALPAGGPWLKASEAIDYARQVKPKKAFPVHDGMFRPGPNFMMTLIESFLAKDEIKFAQIELNKETEL